MSLNEKLNEIINIVKSVIPLKEAYLFGSHAYGQAEKSDLDLYFIVDNLEGERFDTVIEIRTALFDVETNGIDVLLNTKADFDYRASNKATLEYKVLKDGIKLYGK